RYLHVVAIAQIALYRGDPAGALALLSAAWPRLVASMSLYVQNFRVTLRHLRARCALGLLAQSGARISRLRRWRLLQLARTEAKRLSSEDVVWAPALARLIDAGVAAVTDARSEAAEHLERAAKDLRGLDMMLHAAAADHERGLLISGDAGRALRRSAETWMLDARVQRPERLAAMLVPGFTAGC
ncbi:MAG TPA: hypothetical protein VM925_27695, partial [Labilithrix sp.]|nr:hypothetical protein [Labilithrix sp.]